VTHGNYWDHPESGDRADPQKIIQAVRRTLASAGSGNDDLKADPRALDWDNPRHRAKVRDRFAQNAGESARSQEALLPGFGPEGNGENAREDCGNPHPFLCSSCANSVEFGRTCSQSVCARCGVAWVRDAAIKKAAKVQRVRKEQYKRSPSNVDQYEHHGVISPPLGWYYDLAHAGLTMQEAQEKTRDVVKRILDDLRLQGVLIRHSYRGQHEDGSIKDEHDDRGAWKERLNSDRDWNGDVREDLAWKPHYHAIVVGNNFKTRAAPGEDVGLTERVEQKTGWVIHRIEDSDKISLENDKAMAKALMYSLSHADIEVHHGGNNQSCVWEVGAFKGYRTRSSSELASQPQDLDWADAVIREASPQILGLQSGTTDCGASIPAVPDPTQLAIKVMDEIWPQDEPVDVDTDAVLAHISEGNLRVSTSSTSSGYEVAVTDAQGNRLNGSAGTLPDLATDPFEYDGDSDRVPSSPLLDEDREADSCGDDCDLDHDHDRDQHSGDGGQLCDGQLIPLEEARERGLLEDDDWLDKAAHAADALAVDCQYPEGLRRFGEPPGKAIGAS
jgi:hypothetical protein